MNTKSSVRIFHISDVHLDSPFAGLDVRESDVRRREHREAFLSALDLAKQDGCELMLIAGDLFDCGYVTEATVSTVLGAIERLPFPVVLSPGNHDPYTPNGIYARKSLPQNLHVFSREEMDRVDFDDLCVSVHGYAFLSNRYFHDPFDNPSELREGYVNLLCAHTELDEAIPRFAPIKSSRFESSGFDYAALGHVHKHANPVRAGKTTYSYGGFAFGRSFDELGFGRMLRVDVDRDRGVSAIESIRIADKQYVIEAVDVSGAETDRDIIARISEAVKDKGYGEESSLRIVLEGAVSPDLTIPNLSGKDLGVSLLQIKNETLPVLDSEYLEHDLTLKGALYRQLLPRLRSEDERERRVAAEALRIGLCALEGKSFI
jgi:DNA repair exonuclease SbcCD nuclease subunit